MVFNFVLYLKDVVYLVKDLWNARSARAQTSTMSKGLWRNTADLCLTRWDHMQPASLDNLILLTLDEAYLHDIVMKAAGSRMAETLDLLKKLEPEYTALVEARFDRARQDFGLVGNSIWRE